MNESKSDDILSEKQESVVHTSVAESLQSLSNVDMAAEVKKMRSRASFFRVSGLLLLLMISFLLAFGGYVFFAANDIAVREVAFIRDAQIEEQQKMFELQEENMFRMQEILKKQTIESQESINVLRRQIDDLLTQQKEIEILKEIEPLEKREPLQMEILK